MPAVPPALLNPLFELVREADEGASCNATCVRNWKIGFSALLVAEGLFFGYIIFFLRRFLAKKPDLLEKISTYSHAVSGGIFLATGFMHLLPEAVEILAGGHSDEPDRHGDEHGDEHDEEHHDDEKHEGEEGHSHGDVAASTRKMARALVKVALRKEEDHDHDEHGHGDEHGDEHSDEHDDGHGGHEGHVFEFNWAMFTLLMSFYFLFFIEKIAIPAFLKRARSRMASKVGEEEDGKAFINDHEHGHEHELVAPEAGVEVSESDKRPGINSFAFLAALIGLSALTVHVVFESIALGSATSFLTLLNIFIAIASHRWAFALALSVPLSRRVSHLAFAVLLFIFSIVVPIGAVIGGVVSSVSSTAKGVLFAFSTGSFLYLGVVECMGMAFAPGAKGNHLLLFMVTLLGAGVIFAVTGILAAAGVEHAD